jgi:E-phenylitaconyl-CoA hydratase
VSIQLQIEGPIATLRLDRPEVLNAIDETMRRDIQAAWRQIADDRAIRVGIITGAGERAFSAGADLKAAQPTLSHAERTYGDGMNDALTHGMPVDKPLVCAFNGLALGGGLEIGLACDIRIAAEGARFGLPEVRVGTIPGSGGTQRLPRLVGRSDAMLMLLTGDTIDAAEALRIGLVSKVVPAAELQQTALAIARRIADNAPLSVRAVKRLVDEGADLPMAAALAAERAAWGLLRDTEDRREGRAAFAAKRKPDYRGR